ncbi:LCP family protein [Kitasatospora sp. NBC_01287]|uniref:LCP family protein n=1 Tax=Kitasatospora sp. NBC_01287 TaxID=2903573 RepID=UPI00225A07FA|nr:LCP family protein [Kitasatospora sp. NBC_01287]MCX4747875.1 LCP family protein [Kitasatospora sp. NBC_01287]
MPGQRARSAGRGVPGQRSARSGPPGGAPAGGDAPAAPAAAAAAAAAAGGRAAARRARSRRGPSRKKIIVWTAAGAVLLGVGATGAVYLRLTGNIKSFDRAGIATERPPAATADANGNKPVNVLLIGSDSRGGGNSDLGGGGDDGARSDTTILLHVYADHKHAVGVSIPRDSLVEIPSCLVGGKWTKPQPNTMFNAAFSMGNTDTGNPACTQNTVEHLTGLRVDHTLVVDFSGFSAMTGAVGGVQVCLPNAVYQGDLDPNLGHKGSQIFAKGLQNVSGQQALDYVRVRHGIGDGSDIGRMQRQQAFLSALIKKVKGQGMDPTTLLPLADAATKSVTVDPDLATPEKLLSFGLSMKNIDLHDVKFITVPWRFEGARVAWVKPDSDRLWAAVKADRTLDGQDAGGQQADAPASGGASSAAPASPPAPSPAAVNGAGAKVTVYNGTTTRGLSTTAAAELKAAGFTVAGLANAAAQNHDTTVIQYGATDLTAAQQLARLFPGARLEKGSAAGLNLVLGKDYATTAGGAPSAGAPSAAAASAAPAPLPSSIADNARSADDDPCANLSYNG